MRSVVIVAAGSGSRFGGNKIFAEYCGVPLIKRTVAAFDGIVDETVLVVSVDSIVKARGLFSDGVKIVTGGNTRMQSVINGLQALSPDSDLVAVHDGARPFVSPALIEKCFVQAEKQGSAIPALWSSDSVYRNGKPEDRKNFSLAQTPQTFDTRKLIAAYETFDGSSTDDGGVFFAKYGTLHFVEGEPSNRKITFPCDLPNVRTGCGFDLHPLTKDRPMVIGGVQIPCDVGPSGHSDGDAVLHAITDAVLCAAGEKDIGNLFPDTDERFRNADSSIFLKEALHRATSKGFAVAFVGLTVIAQKPRLSPYIDEIRKSVAAILGISPLLVNANATTAEKLGTIGEGKAIACDATATLAKLL